MNTDAVDRHNGGVLACITSQPIVLVQVVVGDGVRCPGIGVPGDHCVMLVGGQHNQQATVAVVRTAMHT